MVHPDDAQTLCRLRNLFSSLKTARGAGANNKAYPLADYLHLLTLRWERAVRTSHIIDAMRAGYCTVDLPGAPPTSDMRH